MEILFISYVMNHTSFVYCFEWGCVVYSSLFYYRANCLFNKSHRSLLTAL